MLFLLKCGSMLHAQLEIWKAAVEESPRNTLAASWSPAGVVQSPNSAVTPTVGSATTASLKESPCAIDFSDGTLHAPRIIRRTISKLNEKDLVDSLYFLARFKLRNVTAQS